MIRLFTPLIAASLLFGSLCPSPAAAQAQAASPAVATATSTTLDRTMRAALLDSIAALVEQGYVFPDSGRRFAGLLRAKKASDAYAAATNPDAFARAVMDDLREASHDRHMGILSPSQARARFVSPTGVRDVGARARAERAQNYYFQHAQTLPGNVGYLRLRQFAIPDSGAMVTAAAEMRLLANADAVILDFRGNPGGAEGLNQFLSSYFFTDPSTVLYRRYYREGDSTLVARVLPTLPGPRMPAVPLFILIDGRSGSSSENMSYALQGLRRATLVGEPTAGAANSSTIAGLPYGFAMQLPVARVISPVTGTNWEGVGVQPDVRAASDSAVAVAYDLALKRLIQSATDSAARAALQVATRAGLPASLAPTGRPAPALGAAPAAGGAPVAPTALAAYAGSYGDRTITLRDGTLFLQRPGGASYEMAPTGPDIFILKEFPQAQIAFGRDAAGAVTEIRVLAASGAWEKAPRSR